MSVQTITYSLGSIPEWITSLATFFALVGVGIAYREYNERTRPYIDLEIQTTVNKDDKSWSFSALLVNRGEYPVFSKLTNTLLTIGDEKYPSVEGKEVILFPGEQKKTFMPVGYITEIGRKKIREAKYTTNVVELLVEASSRKLKQKKYKYKTTLRVQILVEEEKPSFVLLEEKFV